MANLQLKYNLAPGVTREIISAPHGEMIAGRPAALFTFKHTLEVNGRTIPEVVFGSD